MEIEQVRKNLADFLMLINWSASADEAQKDSTEAFFFNYNAEPEIFNVCRFFMHKDSDKDLLQKMEQSMAHIFCNKETYDCKNVVRDLRKWKFEGLGFVCVSRFVRDDGSIRYELIVQNIPGYQVIEDLYRYNQPNHIV